MSSAFTADAVIEFFQDIYLGICLDFSMLSFLIYDNGMQPTANSLPLLIGLVSSDIRYGGTRGPLYLYKPISQHLFAFTQVKYFWVGLSA